jgi:clan AA aspartic protease (TIGR02281 family)
MDIGFGTTRIDVSDIQSTARSSSAENGMLRKKWHDRAVQPVLQPLMEKLRSVGALRIRAINRVRELERLDCEIDSLERSLSAGIRDYEALNPDLQTMTQKSLDDRYRLVGKAHELNASIISQQQALEQKRNEQQSGNPALLEYTGALSRMDDALCAFKKTCTPKVMNDNLAALHGIEGDLKECKTEFKTAATDATFVQGNHIIVKVSINGKTPVLLLLDTGASTVTLSRRLASRLGINWRDGVCLKATLANGETVAGYSVLLRSVAVGEFRAANVRAVVLEKPPAPGIDGLLGMSYLQRFVLNIDPASRKFTMQKIIAR